MRYLSIISVVLIVVVCMFSYEAVASNDGAYIASYKGDVKVVPSGSRVGTPASTNMRLSPGDWLTTGKHSEVTIGFDSQSGCFTKISEDSLVEIKNGEPEWIKLVDGKLLARLQGMDASDMFMVRTPVSACGARGTGWTVTTNGVEDNIKVFESRVFMRGIDIDGSLMEKEVWIEQGYEGNAKKNETPQVGKKLSQGEMKALWDEAYSLPKVKTKTARTSSGIVEMNGKGVNASR